MCVLSIKVPIRKKSGNLFNHPRIWFLLVWFYGISTIIGYSISNPLYTYILNIYNLVLFCLVLWHINHCRLFKAKSSLYIYIEYIWLFNIFCPVGWGCRIHRLLLCWGVRPPNECPGYDTKQSDGEVPAVLELWGMRSTPSLSSLPGPLWPGVVAPDKGPIYGSNRTNGILITYNCLNSLKWKCFWQLNSVLMLNWIVLNRTDYLHKNGFGVK